MADIEVTPEENGNYRRPFSFYAADEELNSFTMSPNGDNQSTKLGKPGSSHPLETKFCKHDDTETSLELSKLQSCSNGASGPSHSDKDLSKRPNQRQNERPKALKFESCEHRLSGEDKVCEMKVESKIEPVKNWEKLLLAGKEANKNGERSSTKPRPDLTTILNQIVHGKLPAADAPIMTDVIAKGNMFRIRIPNVRELQQFAEDMKENKKFELMKTRPIRLELNGRGGVNKLSRDRETLEREEKRCEQITREKEKKEKERVEVDVVFKVFLNGVHSHSTTHDQFVSVCLSVVNRNEQQKNDDVSQNILKEEWLIVSVYLKEPNSDDNPYRRDFKMKFCPELEKEEKGLAKFIEKEKFDNYIAQDGFVTLGVSIQLESI